MVVYANEHLEVHYDGAGSGPLLVTFNEMGMQADGTRYWAQALARKARLPALGFVSRQPNWFPPTAMQGAIEAVAPLLAPHRQVITCGHSQGGYAALKYSRALGASHAIAFAAQWSIAPADTAGRDARFAQWFDPATQGGCAIRAGDLGGQAFVFYDPLLAPDRWHVERLLALGGELRCYPVYGSGHATVRPFARPQVFGRLLQEVLQGSASSMRAFVREARRGWPHRAGYLASSAGARHSGLAARIAERHPGQFHPEAYLQVAPLLLAGGQVRTAMDLSRSMLAQHPRLDYARELLDAGAGAVGAAMIGAAAAAGSVAVGGPAAG